jgi:hypothetical protein
MAFKADFVVDGKTYRVLHFTYSFHQSTDNTGRVSSLVQGGTLTLEVESTKDTSLLEWMTADDMKKDGSVKFYSRTNQEQVLKELKFNEAYMVSYTESFSTFGDNPMSEQFTLSAKKVSINNAVHENEWQEST